MSKFEQKPGTGTLWPPQNKTENGPSLKGFLQLEDGRVVGVAAWTKKTREGKKFLSISQDNREGEYHAKKLGLEQFRADGRPDNRQHADQRSGRGGDGGHFTSDDDLDDEIPF
jgi:hypothetical protein